MYLKMYRALPHYIPLGENYDPILTLRLKCLCHLILLCVRLRGDVILHIGRYRIHPIPCELLRAVFPVPNALQFTSNSCRQEKTNNASRT